VTPEPRGRHIAAALALQLVLALVLAVLAHVFLLGG
jgi:hypothetical protein